MCLLNENVSIKRNLSIDQKGACWTKMCLLTENVPIEWRCAYWMKMCLLIENVCIE